MCSIDFEKIKNEIRKLNISEKEKKLFLGLFQQDNSPIKFKYETLDDKLKPFFNREKSYYLKLEEYFKDSINIYEMIKKFVEECNLRVRQRDLQNTRFKKIITLIPLIEKLKTKSICPDEYYTIKECYNTFDKINHCYPMQYNSWLFQRFFFNYILGNDFMTIPISLKTHYFIDTEMFDFLINNELSYLKAIKYILKKTNKNIPIKELLKFAKDTFSTNRKILFYSNTILKLISNSNKNSILHHFNFFKKIDLLEKVEEKITFIEFLEENLNLLKKLSSYDFNILKKNLQEYIEIDELIEAFLKFISNSNIFLQIINTNDSVIFDNKRFYLELDFSLPEDLIIQQVKTLYKEYKKGNIKNIKEDIYQKEINKYSYLNELQNNYIFKLKNDNTIPLYVKLVDLIYILDMWLINMKNVFVIRNIENNRLRYDKNSFKSFESTYKVYKKFITKFYLNKEFLNYL